MVKILIETLKKYRHNFTDIHKLITQRKEIIEYNWSLLRRIKVIRLIEQLCSFFSPVGKKTELSVRPNTYVRFETNPLLAGWMARVLSLSLLLSLLSLSVSLSLHFPRAPSFPSHSPLPKIIESSRLWRERVPLTFRLSPKEVERSSDRLEEWNEKSETTRLVRAR